MNPFRWFWFIKHWLTPIQRRRYLLAKQAKKHFNPHLMSAMDNLNFPGERYLGSFAWMDDFKYVYYILFDVRLHDSYDLMPEYREVVKRANASIL